MSENVTITPSSGTLVSGPHRAPEGEVCLPGANAFLTLCGWVDVAHGHTDEPANCEGCLRVAEHVLALAAEREVIRSKPRDGTLRRIFGGES